MKKFCLLTTGRTGSTSLMAELEKFEEIAVPNKNVDCANNELLHPNGRDKYRVEYRRLCGRPVTTPNDLIKVFYQYNAAFAYAGFKTMPKRHEPFGQFAAQQDIQFITLIRKDVLSTVASFMLAIDSGVWRRVGGKPRQKWVFEEHHQQRVARCVNNVQFSINQINQVPNAIRLTYEDLCNPDYRNQELNEFFGREISLSRPLPPISGEIYVKNWGDLKEYANTILGLA